MTPEQLRLTLLVGKELARLAPLIDRACEALYRPGTRDLRSRIAKTFNYALTVHEVIVKGDETGAFDGPYREAALPHAAADIFRLWSTTGPVKARNERRQHLRWCWSVAPTWARCRWPFMV